MKNGLIHNLKPLEILTEGQVETIWSRVLYVLRKTGIRFEHPKALDVFDKNGCDVDRDDMRVRFPEGLVEECLKKAPSSFRLKARDPENDLILGGSTVHFIPFPGMQTVDLDTWNVRPPTKQEFIDGTRVLDALDHLHCFGSYSPYFGYEGVPPVMAIPEGFALNIIHSTKAQFMQGTSQGCEIFNIMLAKAVGMEYCGVVAASAPMTFYADQIDGLFRFIEAGFPLVCGGGHVMGGTGPATFAGSLVMDMATDIAPMVLVQLLKPGTRALSGDVGFAMNMRSGSPDFGAIGTSLHQVARAQLSRRFPMPYGALACGVSSSKIIDFQCGYEKAISVLTAAMCGSNIIWLHGGIHGELTHHPVQAILDDDIAGMIGRFIRGIEVNEETLAVDLIDSIGPIPGHYLSTEHTRKWWAKEQFVPKAADRSTPHEWAMNGQRTALDYARQRMDDILGSHEVSKPLTDKEEAEIERILKEGYAYYKKKEMI